MKIVGGYLLLLLLFSACSHEQELLRTEQEVEVRFQTRQPATIPADPFEQFMPSILIFAKDQESGTYSRFTHQGRPGEWHSEDGKLYEKLLILPSGTYRFLMASGFSESDSENQASFRTVSGQPSGLYADTYSFAYPLCEDGKLNTCRTELFVDSNEGGSYESNDREYSLVEGNKFSVRRKMTRLQGRLDLLVRRGVKENGIPKPMPEGDDNQDAMQNALRKIESIRVVVKGVSSCCLVDGLAYSAPNCYDFLLKEEEGEFTFVPFDSDSFSKEFAVGVGDAYKPFDHSAYCKGPLLLPAPDEVNVKLDITIDYKGPLATRTISNHPIALKRNAVSMLTLWLLIEEVGLSVTIDSEHLQFGTQEGDDGFWN